MSKNFLALILCLASIAGCSRQEPPRQPHAQGEKLVIGLIPEQNIFLQMERYQPLVDYLSSRTGIRITLKVLPRYGNILKNFQSGEMDGAFYGSFTYAIAHAQNGVQVIVRPVGLDNASTYHGLIFARKRSGIRGARDIKGKRFAFVDKATTAGFLFPLVYFHENGISNYAHYLKEFYFAGTHEDVIRDVLDGKADVGAAKNTVFERLARKEERIRSELVVLAKSSDVPENGLAFRTGVPAETRERIAGILLRMDSEAEGRDVLARFGALKFIRTTDDDFLPVYRYAESIHLDLSTYDYDNR